MEKSDFSKNRKNEKIDKIENSKIQKKAKNHIFQTFLGGDVFFANTGLTKKNIGPGSSQL